MHWAGRIRFSVAGRPDCRVSDTSASRAQALAFAPSMAGVTKTNDKRKKVTWRGIRAPL